MKYFLDPPSGWQYGFPKECPREVYENEDEASIKAWMIEEGYPESYTKAGWFYYRVIMENEDGLQ